MHWDPETDLNVEAWLSLQDDSERVVYKHDLQVSMVESESGLCFWYQDTLAKPLNNIFRTPGEASYTWRVGEVVISQEFVMLRCSLKHTTLCCGRSTPGMDQTATG